MPFCPLFLFGLCQTISRLCKSNFIYENVLKARLISCLMIESPIADEVLTAQLPEQQSLLMSNELILNAKSEAFFPPKLMAR